MDFLDVLLWCGFGVIVAGVVGHLRGSMGTGMVCGLLLGPIFGTILVMVLTLDGKVRDPRNVLEPRDRSDRPPS